MKRVVFILLLVYASSILNVPELCAQKVQAGWVHVTTEKEKKEKEKKEKEKKEKEKKEKEKKEDNRDYIHSVGIAVGSSYGLAYKYFFMNNWALKVDATDNVWKGIDEGSGFVNFDFNPNVVYQMPIKTFKTCRLDFFAGGGTTLGYAWVNYGWMEYHKCDNKYRNEYFYDTNDTFVWGFNGILGLEVNLAVPMTIEFDLRPGYGLFAGDFRDNCYYCKNYFHNYTVNSFFDWSVNMTISYKF